MSEEHFGNCYEYAFKFVMDNPVWKLVHGTVTNRVAPFQSIYHAWCEYQNVIYDASLGKCYAKENYEDVFNSKADKTYTFDQAVDMAYEYRHYGLWEEPTIIANQEEYYDENGNLKKEYWGEHDYGKSEKRRQEQG